MPFILTNPEVHTQTSTSYNITNFEVDLDQNTARVRYAKLDSDGNIIDRENLHIPDLAPLITDANTVAGSDVYAAIKASMYNAIEVATGRTGTIA